MILKFTLVVIFGLIGAANGWALSFSSMPPYSSPLVCVIVPALAGVGLAILMILSDHFWRRIVKRKQKPSNGDTVHR